MISLKHIVKSVPTQLSTLGDQCLVSGSNFSVNILLVSFLGMELFGVFSFIWLAVLFVSGIQQSLIIMPMYSLNAKTDNQKKYLGKVYQMQWHFSVISTFITFLLFIGVQHWTELTLIQGFLSAITVGLFVFQDFLRRILFVVQMPLQTFLIDIIGFGFLPIILILMHATGVHNLNSLLFSIIVTKLISSMMGIYFLQDYITVSKEIKSTVKRHWEYSKYLFASSILQWFSGNIFVLFSGILLGPSALGALRVAQNVLGILNIFFLFLENSVPIQAAQILHKNGKTKFRQYMLKTAKKYFVLLILCLLTIFFFQDQILTLLYGNAMQSFEWLIPAFCGLYVLIFAGTILRFVYRTIEQNHILFYGYITSSVIGLSFSYPLIKSNGLYGVIIGLFITQISSLITYLFYFKLKR